MKKLKNLEIIIIGILLCAIVVFVVFIKNVHIKAGISCLTLGIIVFIISWSVNTRSARELANFETEGYEILQDIAINGQASQFYGVYDINILNKLRTKLIKRNKKQLISCIITGVVLIICGIFCML